MARLEVHHGIFRTGMLPNFSLSLWITAEPVNLVGGSHGVTGMESAVLETCPSHLHAATLQNQFD